MTNPQKIIAIKLPVPLVKRLDDWIHLQQKIDYGKVSRTSVITHLVMHLLETERL